jgi:serine/threonine protein phosphatase PrpC
MEYTLSTPIWLNQEGKRPYNEDYILPKPAVAEDRIFMVCDGVGGSAKGDVAAETVCRVFMEEVKRKLLILESTNTNSTDDFSPESQRLLLNSILKKVESELDEKVKVNPSYKGMASTITYLHLSSYGAVVAWAGDSRVYQFRNGQALQQTEDHSLVYQLYKRGEIEEHEMADHPRRNIILRAVSGSKNPTKLDVKIWKDIQPGDVFLLCTDGILEGISDTEIAKMAMTKTRLEDIRDKIDEDCNQFSNDNYSMIMLKVVNTKGQIKAPPPSASTAITPASNKPLAETEQPTAPIVAEKLPSSTSADTQQEEQLSKGRKFRILLFVALLILGISGAAAYFTQSWPFEGKARRIENAKKELKALQDQLKEQKNLEDSISISIELIDFLKRKNIQILIKGSPELKETYEKLKENLDGEKEKLKSQTKHYMELINASNQKIFSLQNLEKVEDLQNEQNYRDGIKNTLVEICKRIGYNSTECEQYNPSKRLEKTSPSDEKEIAGNKKDNCEGIDETKAPWNKYKDIFCKDKMVIVSNGETYGVYYNGNEIYNEHWASEYKYFSGPYFVFKKKATQKFGILSSKRYYETPIVEFKYDSASLEECPGYVVLTRGDRKFFFNASEQMVPESEANCE